MFYFYENNDAQFLELEFFIIFHFDLNPCAMFEGFAYLKFTSVFQYSKINLNLLC